MRAGGFTMLLHGAKPCQRECWTPTASACPGSAASLDGWPLRQRLECGRTRWVERETKCAPWADEGAYGTGTIVRGQRAAVCDQGTEVMSESALRRRRSEAFLCFLECAPPGFWIEVPGLTLLGAVDRDRWGHLRVATQRETTCVYAAADAENGSLRAVKNLGIQTLCGRRRGVRGGVSWVHRPRHAGKLGQLVGIETAEVVDRREVPVLKKDAQEMDRRSGEIARRRGPESFLSYSAGRGARTRLNATGADLVR